MRKNQNVSPGTETDIKMYFTGELDQRIRRFKRKKRQHFPDEYYCTLTSVSYVSGWSSTNNIYDPTGQRAVKLADLSRCRSDDYFYHRQLKRTISEVLESCTGLEIKLLKAKLRLTDDSIKKVATAADIDYKEALDTVGGIISKVAAKTAREKLMRK